jgi:geranylgeranyl pyrophosphate synthase/predicted secreted hydrolase
MQKEAISYLEYPIDWPEEGVIDLDIHDLPHMTSTLEWWYQNAHLECAGGRKFSMFVSFFRKMISYDEASGEADYAHSISWALIDLDKEKDREKNKYYNVSIIDQRAPEKGLEKLRNGELVKDSRFRRAAIEMLEKGNVPYPDRLFKQEITIEFGRLFLDYDGNILQKDDEGSYLLKLYDDIHKVGCELKFEPRVHAIRHGDNGIVEGSTFEDMFYYFIPNNKVTGQVTIGEESLNIVNGTGWYDHEFGAFLERNDKRVSMNGEPRKGNLSTDASWNWLGLQLDNGYQLTCYDLYDNVLDKACKKILIAVDPQGNRLQVEDFNLESHGEDWTSMRTFIDYPVNWKLQVPELDIDLEIRAHTGQQEFATVISKPAFWEGRVDATGTFGGTSVNGPGFIERSGYVSMESMEDFFKVVSRETLKSIRKVLPLIPAGDKLNELVIRRGQNRYTEHIDSEEYSKALIEPIRTIIDRGGKSWRSYAALACCDIVGGNSQVVRDWLALPELMHVGSLIIDDVQDKSSIRRGGQTIHLMYGEDVAINAGSACYFLGQIIVYETENLDDKRKVEIYNLYFEALRAGHSGQALDIHGLDYMMDDVVKNGGDLLIQRVIAIHRLKSAVPASSLASMGATMGGGTPEQSAALGEYFESLGIAFQIVDDALNLKGFKDGLKSKGEDITAGKITYPVAVAMSRLGHDDRKRLWEIISSKPEDGTSIGQAIELIDKVDAIDGCLQQAKDIMEEAWILLDPLIEDSMVKLNLRAFSWYVLDRQY